MVYVDNMKEPYQHFKGGYTQVMCHMIADSHGELIEMASKIGVQLKWIQKQGTYAEHFDICKSKRLLAVGFGAKEISMKELVGKMLDKKKLQSIAKRTEHV